MARGHGEVDIQRRYRDHELGKFRNACDYILNYRSRYSIAVPRLHTSHTRSPFNLKKSPMADPVHVRIFVAFTKPMLTSPVKSIECNGRVCIRR